VKDLKRKACEKCIYILIAKLMFVQSIDGRRVPRCNFIILSYALELFNQTNRVQTTAR
jgi:hypothetical protein